MQPFPSIFILKCISTSEFPFGPEAFKVWGEGSALATHLWGGPGRGSAEASFFYLGLKFYWYFAHKNVWLAPPLSRSTHSAQIHPIWRIRWGFSWTPPGRVLKQQPASRTHRPHASVASSSVALLSHSGLCHLVRDSTSPPLHFGSSAASLLQFPGVAHF